MKKTTLFGIGLFYLQMISAQVEKDSSLKSGKNYSFHIQSTTIPQYHFDFTAPYQGDNSLLASEPVQTSFSATIFLQYKMAKHSYWVFNPEAAGGKGLSKTLGIAGFPNGEVYRVGDPNPKPFIARLYFEQRFPLSNRMGLVDDDLNQVAEKTNQDYVSVIVGKFSLTDFFDDSQISHDPRTQFMNWSLMSNGGWDYPANTRGYTMGAVIQALYHDWAFRTALTTVPIEANGPELQFKWGKAMGMVWELEKTHLFQRNATHFTTLHSGIFWNKAQMGNYRESIDKAGAAAPDITDSRMYGRDKWGFYLSFDNHFGPVHQFIKGSWNDGRNETWAFTEIDRSFTTGIQFDGNIWKRKQDKLALAYVSNGISPDHRNYLSKGGYGFLIGDGKLNYRPENIIEAYYSFGIGKLFKVSPDYQLVINPAYNADRGPVHIFALRLHVEW